MAKLAAESDLTNIVLTAKITRDNNEDLLNRMAMNQVMQFDEAVKTAVANIPLDSDVGEEASAAVTGLAEMSQDYNEDWHSRMAMNQARQADEAVEEPFEAPAPQLVDSLDDDPLGPVAGDEGAGAVAAPQPVDPLDDDPLGPGTGDAAAGSHAIEEIVEFFVSKQCAGYITGKVFDYFMMFCNKNLNRRTRFTSLPSPD